MVDREALGPPPGGFPVKARRAVNILGGARLLFDPPRIATPERANCE
ncbi:hypothetical protein CYFUS_006467 [Cystobacter fuscus]|uniref:Uncharacterized protein n=1 Tax=Cystobacter fuscus TaxID=43 RepID=A0A250JAR5_9BACT|nr:hypothetical protein CYFUS_006467 [Cystobacter fuscus]